MGTSYDKADIKKNLITAIAVISIVLFSILLSLAYRYLTEHIIRWFSSSIPPTLLTYAGAFYAGVFVINTVAFLEVAFFYRLVRLGACNLGITPLGIKDILGIFAATITGTIVFETVIIAAKLKFGAVQLHFPPPLLPSDFAALVLLILVTAAGIELYIRAFIHNYICIKKGLHRLLFLITASAVSFAALWFLPVNALAFACASVPFALLYLVRRNILASLLAQILFFSGITIIEFLHVI